MSTSPLIPVLAPTAEIVSAVEERWTVADVKGKVLDHLSPSSLGMLQRCPFQFWRRYILGERERPGEGLVVGSAVHAGLERNFTHKITTEVDLPAEELQEWLLDEGWAMTVAEQEKRAEMEIAWDGEATIGTTPEALARRRAVNMTLAYHRQVAPRIQPLSTEGWVEANLGIKPKVVGRYDVETLYRLIDYKTGKQLTTKPKPEWRMQAGCYETITDKGIEFQSIASSKTGRISIATPMTHPELEVRLAPSQKENVVSMIRGLAGLAQYYFDTYGIDRPWPPTGWMHPWACSYCGWRKICPAWGTL